MANNSKTYTIRGKAMYAKVLGDPVLNFSKDGKEWAVDLLIDAATAKEFKGMGIADRVKRREDRYDGQPYVHFRQRYEKMGGGTNDPITVVDILGKAWDQKALIGNGSTVDVQFAVRDYGIGKKAGVYPRTIRVLDHIPYEGGTLGAVSEDDEFFKAALAAQEKAQKQAETGSRELDDSVEDIGEDEVM